MRKVTILSFLIFVLSNCNSSTKSDKKINPSGIEDELILVHTKQIDSLYIKRRNLLSVTLDSNDSLFVNGKPVKFLEIQEIAIEFLNNYGKNYNLPENPHKAIVSYQTHRGTSYKIYLEVLDELKGAYYHLRADYLDIPLEDYFYLKNSDKEDQILLKKGKTKYPMQLTESAPTE